MKLEDTVLEKDYYKIALVGLKPDKCDIIKGPEEEKRLADILLDDYHISRYEKMVQLVVKEEIEESYHNSCFQIFSLKYLQQAFEEGKDHVTCSYLRKVNGEMQMVSTSIYPRKFGEDGELEVFMIYVSKK